MAIEIRQLTEDELPLMREITGYSFADNSAEPAPVPMVPEWTLCGFVDGRLATSFAAFPFRVRLNGASVAMAGVTMVATMPEFRRRGILRAIMTRSFGEQRDRGEAFAILHASMGAIYQRYGYGMASAEASYEIDPRHIQFVEGEPASGRVRLYSTDEARPVMQLIYREFSRPRNLMIQRAPQMWDIRLRDMPDGKTRAGIYETPDGTARGYVLFRVVQRPTPGPGPGQSLEVFDAAWLDPDAYRGLWDFYASHDLVARVTWKPAPTDDPAPLLLAEPRMLQRRTGDDVWMRVTDVEAALRSRPYGESGALTVRVRDALCDWNDATFSLETTGPERDARRSDEEPDLEMPVRTLALLLSGQRSATALAKAGLLRASSEKPLVLADRMFATAYAPWCPDGF